MDGMVEVLGERIVDDADEGFELVGEGERDGDVGMCVHEVCGTVYRVDYEGWGRGEAAGRRGLFAQESVGRGVGIVMGFSRQQWRDRCVWSGRARITYE